MLLIVLGGCATPRWKIAPHDELYQRAARPRLHRAPAARMPTEWWETLRQSSLRPLGEVLSPGRHLRRASGGAPALDVNAFGQVPDSTWFENRAGKRRLTVQELRRGPCECACAGSSGGGEASGPPRAARATGANHLCAGGPAPGTLTVLSGKTEGASPGFVVRDRHGARWLVKFDPPAFPGLASSAEVVSTRLMYAAGYHVPDNHVVLLDPKTLSVSPDARTRDDYNREVPFTDRDLKRLVGQLNPAPDGAVTALFSRYLPGKPLGPFAFSGLRPDDPNDRIPHERRRSLRGLWVFSAWLNHTEAWQINTLDTFITVDRERGMGYVRHHLLDFGSTLGSGGTAPKPATSGYSGFVDWPNIGKRLVALGLYYPYWLRVRKSPYRAVGVFEAEVFDPGSWKPDVPNPAFDEATIHDTYWAASILARITPELVREAVRLAGYSEPGSAAHVTRVLLARRKKILRHVFDQVLALDHPRVRDRSRVELDDLEVETGLRPDGGRCSRSLRSGVRRGCAPSPRAHCYQWHARWNRSGARDLPLGQGVERKPSTDLSAVIERATEHGAAFEREPFITVTWWRMQRGIPTPPASVELHLRLACGRLVPVGLQR
jgi:hypothetical protein